MHAYIVTGGTTEERSEHISAVVNDRSISPHDMITIAPDPTSISVDSVRGIAGRLSIHPVASSSHAVVVHDAHAMTIEAQNAFLKTLEEPPGEAIIILETNQSDALLPTILSRCQLITLGPGITYTNEEMMQCANTITSLLEASVGKRLQIIDILAKTRDDALAFVNRSIAALHDELTKRDVDAKLRTNEITKLLRALLGARSHLLGNVTPKLALDAVFLL